MHCIPHHVAQLFWMGNLRTVVENIIEIETLSGRLKYVAIGENYIEEIFRIVLWFDKGSSSQLVVKIRLISQHFQATHFHPIAYMLGHESKLFEYVLISGVSAIDHLLFNFRLLSLMTNETIIDINSQIFQLKWKAVLSVVCVDGLATATLLEKQIRIVDVFFA